MTMRHRVTTIAVLALAGAFLALPALASAQVIGVYRNGMETLAQRSQLVKMYGRNCARAGIKGVMRVTVGKKTEACALRTPVIGRDLEVAATERLLSTTPKKLQHKAFLGLELRAGGNAKYQMRVFPLQHKVQLLRITPEETKYVAIVKEVKQVRELNKANALRLRAFNITEGEEKGHAQVTAYLGSEPIAEVTDAAAGELKGRFSAVVVGAVKNGNGVIASLDNVIVRLPSPF